MCFISPFSEKMIQISLKSKGVFSPRRDLDKKRQKKALFQGRPGRRSVTLIHGPEAEEREDGEH